MARRIGVERYNLYDEIRKLLPNYPEDDIKFFTIIGRIMDCTSQTNPPITIIGGHVATKALQKKRDK